MFLRIPDTVYTPYIGHTQEDGYVLIHGHPLNGTKFYTWGQSGPGRFMQDFLAGGGKGNGYYAELQVGPAPTQMQSFPVPKGSIREWTEWFKGFDGDKENLKGDYNSALNEIDTWMRSSDGMPKKVVDDWDQFFEEHAAIEPSTVLVQGQPWGYLEEKRLGRQLAPGLKFTEPFPDTQAYMEIKPWLDLLEKGTFTEETLKYLPLSYQTTDGWMELLQKSAETHGMTWLHALHIGIGLTERGDIDEPIKLFETSFALKPNPIAARCLGVLQKNYDDSFPYYIKALESLENFKNDKAYFRLMDNLVTETSFFLQQWGRYDIAEDFMPKVPEAHRGLDAFITLQIKFSLNQQKYQDALSLLGSNCFPTYASARLDLMNMWNSAVEGQASLVKGSSLSILEKHQARMKDPIPDNIGCQYASEYCINYW
jgi:tetratricopeptide (TPR) repeat protein